MLNKGAKGALAEGVENEAELYRSMTENGNDSHITSLLYGGGTPLTNSAGVPDGGLRRHHWRADGRSAFERGGRGQSQNHL